MVMLILALGSVYGQEPRSAEVGFSGCWSHPVKDGIGSRLAGDDSNIFVAHKNERVEALSHNGSKLWESDFGGEIASNILVLDSSILLVARNSLVDNDGRRSQLRSLSSSAGITSWTQTIVDAEVHFLHRTAGAVILASSNGIVRSLDPATGQQFWKREIANSFLFAPIADDKRLAIATEGNQVFLISLATGEIESVRKLPFRITAFAILNTDSIMVGDDRGNVRRFVGGGERPLWTMKAGAAVSSIVAVNDRVLIASNDNFVYFLRAASGSVQWKRRYSGRVGFSLSLLGRYSLVANLNESEVFLTELATGKPAGQIVLSEGEGIVVSPLTIHDVVFLISNTSAYAFSMNGCPAPSKGRTALGSSTH